MTTISENFNGDEVLSKLRNVLNIDEPNPQEPATQKMSKIEKLEQQAMNNTPYNASYYDKALQETKKLKEYCQKCIKENRTRSDIVKDINVSARSIMDNYHTGVNNQIKQLMKWQHEYINEYKNKKQEYTNPQAELLHRQDFISKLNAMDENELTNFVKELNSGDIKQLSTYEVNTLLNRVKNNHSLYSQVKVYRDNNYIGKEWEQTEAWQKVQSNLSILNTYKNSKFLYNKPEEGQLISRSAISPQDEALSVLTFKDDATNSYVNYNVSKHEANNIFADETN